MVCDGGHGLGTYHCAAVAPLVPNRQASTPHQHSRPDCFHLSHTLSGYSNQHLTTTGAGEAHNRLGVDLQKVGELFKEELRLFESLHPRSGALYAKALGHFLYGAPMHWMQQWPGSYPIYVAEAQGAEVTDVDGHQYVDFALGDTGAMFGHANPPVVEAITRQLKRGATFMLPTEDSVWVGEELARRFSLPYWQVTTSATDANRFVIRLCRMITGRHKVLTFNWNYHGSVDETQVELDNARRMISLAERMETGVRALLVQHHLPWHVTRIGARLEYLFSPSPPRNGGEAHRARHPLLEARKMVGGGVQCAPRHCGNRVGRV